ncbi:MAG: hypothetical protein LBF68_02120 [Christensenellaceae bacterium]|jgi:hypothetical protein|nr:hypothetical protein [Christensenellaceae bacterium]
MVFCKSRNFLGETDETLKSHVAFINSVFEVELHQVADVLNMVWFVAEEHSAILYMAGHTGDALRIIINLHSLSECGVGTQIRDIYLNTCTSKPDNEASRAEIPNSSSIVFPWDASEDEKKKIGITEKPKFLTLDDALAKVKDDGFRIHLCIQDTVTDYNVKMAHFLPMDECGLGFSPTKSELRLYNHKGSLAEKLADAFEKVAE